MDFKSESDIRVIGTSREGVSLLTTFIKNRISTNINVQYKENLYSNIHTTIKEKSENGGLQSCEVESDYTCQILRSTGRWALDFDTESSISKVIY